MRSRASTSLTARFAAGACSIGVIALALVAVLDDGDRHAGERGAKTERLITRPALTPPPPAPTRSPPEGQKNAAPGAEAEEQRSAQLGFPRPTRYARGTARRALAEFVAAWRARSYERMATWATPSWRKLQRRPVDRLREKLDRRRLLGWRPIAVEGGSVLKRIRFTIAFRSRLRPTVRRQTFVARMLRERPSGVITSSGGVWGVDPQSLTATG